MSVVERLLDYWTNLLPLCFLLGRAICKVFGRHAVAAALVGALALFEYRSRDRDGGPSTLISSLLQWMRSLALLSLTPAGLLFFLSPSSTGRQLSLLVGSASLISADSLARWHVPDVVFSLLFLVGTYVFDVSLSLALPLLAVSVTLNVFFASRLSKHELLMLKTSLCLALADVFSLVSTAHTIPLSLRFHARTSLIVFEVAILSLFLMIFASFLVSRLLSGLQLFSRRFSPNQQRCVVFAMAVLVVSLTVVMPLLTQLLGVNPFLWLAEFYTLSNALPLSLTLHWIVCIGAFVAVAEWSMRRLALSKTQGRKIFHALMLVMFAPSIVRNDPVAVSFTSLCLGGAVCVFILIEIVRLFLLQGEREVAVINSYFDMFVSGRESHGQNALITSHFSLLLGCAASVWFSVIFSPSQSSLQFLSIPAISRNTFSFSAEHGVLLELIIRCAGFITVGVGDSFAAVLGSKFGRRRWTDSHKSLLGSAAALVSMVFSGLVMMKFAHVQFTAHSVLSVILWMSLTTLAEVFVHGNDNFTLPFFLIIIALSIRF